MDIQRQPRLDGGAAEAVDHLAETLAGDEIHRRFVVQPQIERGIGVVERAVFATPLRNEGLEAEAGCVVQSGPSFVARSTILPMS